MSDKDTTPKGAEEGTGKNVPLRPSAIAALAVVLALFLAAALYFGLRSSQTPPAPEANASGQDTVRLDAGQQGYPFEEGATGLEEQAKAADLLLIRTMAEQAIPSSRLELLDVESKSLNGERYHFQTLRADLDGDLAGFVDGLAQGLRAQGLNATTAQSGPDNHLLLIGGVPTHLFTAAAAPTPPPAPGPKLAIVIDDIGENMPLARGLAELPFPVTLSIWPRSTHAAQAASLARDKGLEVMMHQPMEPVGYPRDKPGPGAVFTNMTKEQIQNTITANLEMVPDASGVNNHMGSNFTRWGPGMAAVLEVLKKRGLFFLDSWTHSQSKGEREAHALDLTFYRRAVFLDNVRDPEAILHQLAKAERLALKTGQAIAIGHPNPETLAALQAWSGQRNATVAVVHVRALEPM